VHVAKQFHRWLDEISNWSGSHDTPIATAGRPPGSSQAPLSLFIRCANLIYASVATDPRRITQMWWRNMDVAYGNDQRWTVARSQVTGNASRVINIRVSVPLINLLLIINRVAFNLNFTAQYVVRCEEDQPMTTTQPISISASFTKVKWGA